MNWRLLLVIVGVFSLSACALSPPQTTPGVARTPVSQLLQELRSCGSPTGEGCAQVHLRLAQQYLEQTPLNGSAIGNADRELQMAAQNPKIAQEVRPWRNLIAAWQQLAARQAPQVATGSQRSCQEKLSQLQAAKEAAETRLSKIEGLLQREALPEKAKP